MTRTKVILPERLKLRSQEKAREPGFYFGEPIRESMERRLEPGGNRLENPRFMDVPVCEGSVPPALSERHDRYLLLFLT